METSITSAMRYLQNKGLCLMPVALASAISIAAPMSMRKTTAEDSTQTAEECSKTRRSTG